MWKDLNAQQKSELMDIFLSKGITSLDEMRSFYDGRDANIYSGEDTPTQQMSYSYTKPLDNVYVDSEGNLLDPNNTLARGTVQLPDVMVTARDPRKPVPTAFDSGNGIMNIVGAATAGAYKLASDAVQGKANLRDAGEVYLDHLSPENRRVAIDAAMHSTRGGEVMGSNDIREYGLPNYLRLLMGKPMDINYTGSYDSTGENPNLNRDLVNLYLKGDTRGFEDVTNDTTYHHGPDYLKYFRENYPSVSPRTYKMYSDGVPLELTDEEIREAKKNMGKVIRMREEGRENADNIANYNRWFKNINGQLYAIDSDVWDFNSKDWSWESGDNEKADKAGVPFILKALRPVKRISDNKKSYGGNLFSGEEDHSQQMSLRKPGFITTGGAGYIPPFQYQPQQRRRTVYKSVDGKVFGTMDEARGHNATLVRKRKEQERKRQDILRSGYIGGEKNDARQKYFDLDKEFTDSVVSISKRYGINPEVTASRIAKEGPVDEAINTFNSGSPDGRYAKGTLYSQNKPETLGHSWGLDDLGERIAKEQTVLTTSAPFEWSDMDFTNEHGRVTNTVYSPQWWFGIEGTAADLRARRDKLKKNNPGMSDELLDAAAAMSYNYGEWGAQDYINKNKRVRPGFEPFIEIDR